MKDNVEDGELVFVDPFFHQHALSFYYNSECFKQLDVYSCNLNNSILSLDYQSDCCSDNTRILRDSYDKKLGDYIDSPIWLLRVRALTYEENDLFNYFNNTKVLTASYSIDDILIYHFE